MGQQKKLHQLRSDEGASGNSCMGVQLRKMEAGADRRASTGDGGRHTWRGRAALNGGGTSRRQLGGLRARSKPTGEGDGG